MKSLWSRVIGPARERGAVMFVVAGSVVAVLLMGAVAVDLSAVSTRGQGLQNAADAAALAGVHAYRDSMEEELIPDGEDESAAEAAVAKILAQNGIGADVDVLVEYPDEENNTEVKVTVTDNSPNLFLGEVTGVVTKVERSATARFERCASGCVKEVLIPPPFDAVDAKGSGDGYKPIPVGDNLYALNHNSGLQSNGYLRGNREIACVSRNTQEHCWDFGPSEVAFPNGYIPQASPEMPHAGVVDTKIYWTSSLPDGHYLYCYETESDTPCSSPKKLNSLARISGGSTRVQNRGGGTIAIPDPINGDKLYVFTDDHRVHCIQPVDFDMDPCDGYDADGLPNGMAANHIPPNQPSDGNHGSSIDRIYDPISGNLYATLHIDNEAPTGSVDCSAPLQDPVGHTVVIQNTSSNTYVSVDSSSAWDDDLTMSNDGDSPYVQWEIVDAGGGEVFLQSAANSRQIDSDGNNSYANTATDSPPYNEDEKWELEDWDGDSYKVKETNWGSRWMQEYYGGVVEVNWSSGNNRWEFWPYQCATTGYTPLPEPLIPYEKGTWLHCWDTGSVSDSVGPCNNFTPRKIHNDSDSFSGRLFFYYGAGESPAVLAVCSTGFTQQQNFGNNMSQYTELTCVNPTDGTDENGREGMMSTFTSALAGTNYRGDGTAADSNAYWGTWGDPHYSADTNRLFYPTHRERSKVLCWDFDTGWCGSVQGWAPTNGEIQDYGFYSQGSCIYGLGHLAVFWAFRAENINEVCTGSGKTTYIDPCNCSGTLYWGTITFDVDIELFDSFLIEIFDSSGARVVPEDPESPGHDLKIEGNETIDLNDLPIINENDQLRVEVTVEAENDPWAQGDQTFTIELARSPRLTD